MPIRVYTPPTMPRPTLNRRRRNITLPQPLDDDLANTAQAIGWTASDVLEHALTRALPELRRMAELAHRAQQGAPPGGSVSRAGDGRRGLTQATESIVNSDLT